MAVAFTRLSLWLWSAAGKDHEPGSNSQMSSSFDFGLGFREQDFIKFPTAKGHKVRKIKKKWHSREERRMDKEYDLVLVPSDGVGLSGSESDDSDWSIGWLEPHAPDFQSDGEAEGSFAVLVPCYGRGRSEKVDNKSGDSIRAIQLSGEYSHDAEKDMEEWLSSIRSG